MNANLTLEQIRAAGERMISLLGLAASPVGVRMLADGESRPVGAKILRQHRYCQALMKARHGESVVLDRDGVACPAAASAFGFRPLPDGLRSGNGLVGFGIVSHEKVAERMFENMPRLRPNQVSALHLFPLDRPEHLPDIVVVEDEVERTMWLTLVAVHASGGERVHSSTAVLQAVCVDATILPYLEQRMNLSYGCYGCREATDVGGGEAVLGFPGVMLPEVVRHLEFLRRKAIPTSRSKRAWVALRRKDSQEAADMSASTAPAGAGKDSDRSPATV